MGDLGGLAVADHDICPAIQNRCHQLRNVGTKVLIVAVGVDDDVGPRLQTFVNAPAEGARQAQVPLVANDVLDPQIPSDLNGAIGTAIINDEDLNPVDARNRTGNVRKSRRKGVLFVVARNLHNQFH